MNPKLEAAGDPAQGERALAPPLAGGVSTLRRGA